jgi:GNAT superfamily N-acetyltransferase
MSRSTAATPRSCLPRSCVGKNGRQVDLHRLPDDAGGRLIEMYLAFQPRNSFQGLPPIKDEVCVRWVREMLATGIHVVATSFDGNGETCGKGDRHLLCEAPGGPFRQKVPVTFSAGGERLPEGLRSPETTSANPLAPPLGLDTTRAIPAIPAGRPIVGHSALFPVNEKKCELLVVVCPAFQNLGIGTELVRSCIALADELGYGRIWLPVDATNVRARHVYRKCGFEYVSDKPSRELDMICDVRTQRSKPTYDLHGPAPHVPAPYFHFPCLTPLADGK